MMLAQGLPHGRAAWPALAAREVHLWWIGIGPNDGDVAAAWRIVSGNERDRARRIRAGHERDRYLLRHHALRAILSGYVGVAAHKLVLVESRFGKPALAAPQAASGLCFNLSRSGDVAVLAVARCRRLGVDVERLRPLPDVDTLARRQFSPGEARALAALPDCERWAGFLRLWTCKEAVVKALGGGLSIALDGFDVGHRVDGPPAITRWQLPEHPRRTLRLLPVDDPPGHAIALAADAPADRCRWLRWPGHTEGRRVPEDKSFKHTSS